MFEMKGTHAKVDDAILREVLRHSLSEEAFALDAELESRFADVLHRWKPKVRADLPAEMAAHILFQLRRGPSRTSALEPNRIR
jgi:hypothetical protein